MKVRLLCEIEADILDKEELESIQNNINKGRSMRPIASLWRKIIEKSLKDVCPKPVYDNKKLNLKVDCFDIEKEIQEFQLGDTAYMIDEDYRFFESTVKRIGLAEDKYYYETSDLDFEYKDIGEWVFKSDEERAMYLEIRFIN